MVCGKGPGERWEDNGELGADPKRALHGRCRSVNIFLQAEGRVKPWEPCRKLGLTACHQRLDGAKAGEASVKEDCGKKPGGHQETDPDSSSRLGSSGWGRPEPCLECL